MIMDCEPDPAEAGILPHNAVVEVENPVMERDFLKLRTFVQRKSSDRTQRLWKRNNFQALFVAEGMGRDLPDRKSAQSLRYFQKSALLHSTRDNCAERICTFII